MTFNYCIFFTTLNLCIHGLLFKLNLLFLAAMQEQNLQLSNEYHSGTWEPDHLPMIHNALQRMLLFLDSKLLLAAKGEGKSKIRMQKCNHLLFLPSNVILLESVKMNLNDIYTLLKQKHSVIFREWIENNSFHYRFNTHIKVEETGHFSTSLISVEHRFLSSPYETSIFIKKLHEVNISYIILWKAPIKSY